MCHFVLHVVCKSGLSQNSHVLQIWELQKDGSWKFAIDYGNSNDKPNEMLKPLEYSNGNMIPANKQMKFASGKANELLDLDRKFNEQVKNTGISKTYLQFLSDSGRIIRDDYFPFIGSGQISKYLSELKEMYSYIPTAGKVSSSNDLGFTYGIMNVSDNQSAKKYNYVRFWKKENGVWKIIIDVAGEIPEGN